MYRIEVAPGEESVFRTIEELAIGIRNGVVTPRARIYHHASEKWLPIGLHPHYKKALEMPAASASNAPVTSTTPIPTSRAKTHPPSHPKPQSVVHFPEPERAPEPPKPIPEHKPVSVATPAPKIPAPVQSPVIAMQNEVLRDLPVISIPEPLPWTVKRAPAVAPTVEAEPAAPVPHLPATHAPRTHAPRTHAPAPQAWALHSPAPDSPAPHAPAPHALAPHALAPHALAPHAPAVRGLEPRAPEPRAPEPRPPEPRLPERRKPEPYRSMEHLPPVEERSDADTAGLPPARPTARRSRRTGGRPLLLLGTAAALVVGTHLMLTATPPAEIDPAAAPVPAEPSEAPKPMVKREEAPQPPAPPSPARTRVTEAPRVTSAPARVSMVPGPAFAGSVPARGGAGGGAAGGARGGADSAAKPKAAVQAPAPEPAAEPSISPAPAAIELALPSIPPDSIVPAARKGDTLGMKRILRALNGSKREDPAGP